MRYTHMFHSPPSPSDAGLIKGKAASMTIHKPRLPKSRHHHIRKASLSTGASSMLSVETPRPAKQEPTHEIQTARAVPIIRETIIEVDAEVEVAPVASALKSPLKAPNHPQLKQWDSYLHWLCLTEEPGTLWTAALCAAFRDCLVTDTTYAAATTTAADSAARIDDIYWSFYLPLDPLLSHMEDRILSGYLLHVWTMFIELGKRIPHDDEGQDRLVELLKELVRLPPMEVRTWEGNDAPWSDLPTLDDALLSAWDDLCKPPSCSRLCKPPPVLHLLG
ncbi:hypothetical protein BD289DRAFT_230889 [Coniella lustricola]|uniref:Uncharacterized protein n=1 Tax=Coniella lustricola TaxID=2025994 RepID=A0A2T3AAE5_9PEZI|nr:hypothetical protein BD289DRAFT_230889 [Coniella lustricola]